VSVAPLALPLPILERKERDVNASNVSRSVSRRWVVAGGLAALVVGAWPARARADLNVVTTVPALAAIAREITGPHASVKSLTRASQDPHFVDARPNLALDLNRADLLLAIGLGLEVGWVPTLVTGARNARILPGSRGYLEVSRFVKLLDVHTQPVDRSRGDIHPGGNPHFLADPRAAVEVAKAVAARLADLDPAHRATYQANLTAFLGRLAVAREGWEKRMAPLRGTPIIQYHRTWVYVADWLGLVEVSTLEPKPGIPPNPSHIAHLLVLARQRKVRVLVQEDYYPESTSRLVAQQIPTALVRVPGGPDYQKGESYIEYIDRMVTLFEQAARSAPGPR
jgi:zinc/manganese transport system substrate-binding protein